MTKKSIAYQNVRSSTKTVLGCKVINLTRDTKKTENKLNFQLKKPGGKNEHQSKIKKERIIRTEMIKTENYNKS